MKLKLVLLLDGRSMGLEAEPACREVFQLPYESTGGPLTPADFLYRTASEVPQLSRAGGEPPPTLPPPPLAMAHWG